LRKEQRVRDSSRMGERRSEHELLRLGNSQQILRLLFTASLANAFASIGHDRLHPNKITNVSGARKTASRANGPDYRLKHTSEIAYSRLILHYSSITSTYRLLPPQSMQTTIQCSPNVCGEASLSTHERHHLFLADLYISNFHSTSHRHAQGSGSQSRAEYFPHRATINGLSWRD
jgi:hypothetical protein